MRNIHVIGCFCSLILGPLFGLAPPLFPAEPAPPATEPPTIVTAAAGSGRFELVGLRSGSEGQKLPELTFLGIMNIRQLRGAACPKASTLVPIPAAEVADTAPEVDPAGVGGEDRWFVCRLNNLPAAERFLLDDARNGRWDDLSFLEAVLIAEGTPPDLRRASLAAFSSALAQLREEIAPVDDEMLRVRTVFEFLRRRLLTGHYEQNHSSVAATLATGQYNCVSATVLFNALASEVGLNVRGVETTGHAKSRVILSDGTLDIETTCTDWELLPDSPVPFPPAIDTESLDVHLSRPVSSGDTAQTAAETTIVPDQGDLSGGAAAARRRAAASRGVSPVEFVATIYFNRGVDFYHQRRFGPALSAYLKASVLDPENQTVLGNLKATLNNLAIELAKRRDYREAIHLTEQCLVLDPGFEQFRVNLPLYYRHWAADLRREGKETEAREADSEAERLLGKYPPP
ncbi:MAG: tetratricopeptide repeat protein [Thermoguttaceae bacterium]|nr:tetratricopeptide repeat protein [Thermoguttaceae bacterium]